MKQATAHELELAKEDGDATPIHTILDALRGLRFGSVTVVVQDGVVVQVERIEKKRLPRSTRRE